ncbi:MAG: undecaprenyl-phosphate glucose phosphotransferase [Planctomycetes bacterium]|nr:undecaprenyl-phosphate glucose phosphotransferase [Planctomycetota bacterium]
MLKQHSQLVLGLLVLADACAVAVAWLGSYWLRFHFIGVDPTKGVPPLSDKYIPLLPLVVAAHLFIFYRLRLYRPRRDQTVISETRDIVKAFFVAIIAIIAVDYMADPDSHKISRWFIATYAVVGTTCFAFFRGAVRIVLRILRSRGYNRRSAAIVGSGRTAQKLLAALEDNPWTGMETHFFIDDRHPGEPLEVRGLPVLGPLANTGAILEEKPVDAVFVALPTSEAHRLEEVLQALEQTTSDIRMVPELNPHYAMRPDITRLDDVPILSLRQTPLYGWNALVKRGFDVVVGTICLLIAAGPMLAIALLIKLTSPGPVFYRQRRVGLDGQEFDMFKFRTMHVDAEKDGPVWSKRNDDRRTSLGAFLRRTSLDELPNLFNVMAGEMSLVGPRPERPEFIEQFKAEIPKYMQRHKMKAGMTGFAQIRGYRGETSLRKRIQHDVHYIRNWSLSLDIRILAATIFGVWFSRHEI